MLPGVGRRVRIAAGVLFFVSQGWVGVAAGADADPLAAELAELRVAVQTVREQNDALRQQLQQQDAQARLLTEQLAIARTESELFQKRWAEAQLRAQTLGVDFANPDARHWQRQVIETIRSLYLAEAERQRLLEELTALVAAVERGGSLTGAVDRARGAVTAAEATGRQQGGSTGTLESARVLDVNAELRALVLNVGLAQGARVGLPFVVLRQDRVIGELRVIEARRNICAAVIESVEKGARLAAGDEVRVLGR